MPPDVPAYEPPPSFAPPALRTAALNEREVLGQTTYPPGAQPVWPEAWRQPAPQQAWPEASSTDWSPAAARGRHRPRRRSVLIGSLVVAALVALTAALTVGNAPSRPPHAIALPYTVAEYTEQHEIGGSELMTMIGAGMFGSSLVASDLRHAKVAIYSSATPTEPGFVFLGFDADQSPTLGAELHRRAPDQVTRQVLDGAGLAVGQERFSPGPLGGALRCAAVGLPGESVSVGVWADHDTLGMLVLVSSGPPPALAFTSRITHRMRAAAET